MLDNNVIISALTKFYDKLRMDAQNRAFEINNTLEKDPVWQENRFKIKNVRMQIARAKFDENTNCLPDLNQTLNNLLQERASILAKKGLTEDHLKVQYACEKCQDSGFWEGGGVCDCFYKNLSIVCEDLLNVKTPNLPTFEDFDESTPSCKKLKTLFLDYTAKFPPEKIKNLVFIGKPGTGKTFSAGCIASALKANNFNVIYLSAVKLNDLFLRYHTASAGDKQAIFSLLTASDLLVIDDLGTEPILKNVTVEYLTATISERLNGGAPFIITTNLTLDEIKSRYTERFSSRIAGSETARFTFDGKDMRMNKK